jgi:hypothetical protein
MDGHFPPTKYRCMKKSIPYLITSAPSKPSTDNSEFVLSAPPLFVFTVASTACEPYNCLRYVLPDSTSITQRCPPRTVAPAIGGNASLRLRVRSIRLL